jgi:hypothetical protein
VREEKERMVCCVCGRQVVNCGERDLTNNDKFVSSTGAKAGLPGRFGPTCFCRYCAQDLDENGNFPEECG